MQQILDYINLYRSEHLLKADKLQTLNCAFDLFRKYYGHLTFDHQNIRGGNVTPVIVLSTKTADIGNVNLEAYQEEFLSSEQYEKYKSYYVTLGTAVHLDKTYFYISCNDHEGYTKSELKDILLNRANREIFPHIENYFT
jgi:hypothetical protein